MAVPRWLARDVARLLACGVAIGVCVLAIVLRADDYRVGPRDVLEVIVVGESDLTGKYMVRADGSFEFPLIGTVKVAGLTAAEIETRLRDRLADGYLRNPQVSARVLDFESQRIFVAGDVAKPGDVPLTGSLTLLEALTKAGGVTTTAGPEVLVLRRSGQPAGTPAGGPVLSGQAGVEEVAHVPLAALQSGRAAENVALRAGDTVFVPRAGVIYVTGEVRSRGPLPYQRGMTVMEAINAAGGETSEGNRKGATIERIVDGKTQKLKAALTDPLQAGDTVNVPRRWW
jgi:polysaccharide export outer membrane protein